MEHISNAQKQPANAVAQYNSGQSVGGSAPGHGLFNSNVATFQPAAQSGHFHGAGVTQSAANPMFSVHAQNAAAQQSSGPVAGQPNFQNVFSGHQVSNSVSQSARLLATGNFMLPAFLPQTPSLGNMQYPMTQSAGLPATTYSVQPQPSAWSAVGLPQTQPVADTIQNVRSTNSSSVGFPAGHIPDATNSRGPNVALPPYPGNLAGSTAAPNFVQNAATSQRTLGYDAFPRPTSSSSALGSSTLSNSDQNAGFGQRSTVLTESASRGADSTRAAVHNTRSDLAVSVATTHLSGLVNTQTPVAHTTVAQNSTTARRPIDSGSHNDLVSLLQATTQVFSALGCGGNVTQSTAPGVSSGHQPTQAAVATCRPAVQTPSPASVAAPTWTRPPNTTAARPDPAARTTGSGAASTCVRSVIDQIVASSNDTAPATSTFPPYVSNTQAVQSTPVAPSPSAVRHQNESHRSPFVGTTVTHSAGASAAAPRGTLQHERAPAPSTSRMKVNATPALDAAVSSMLLQAIQSSGQRAPAGVQAPTAQSVPAPRKPVSTAPAPPASHLLVPIAAAPLVLTAAAPAHLGATHLAPRLSAPAVPALSAHTLPAPRLPAPAAPTPRPAATLPPPAALGAAAPAPSLPSTPNPPAPVPRASPTDVAGLRKQIQAYYQSLERRHESSQVLGSLRTRWRARRRQRYECEPCMFGTNSKEEHDEHRQCHQKDYHCKLCRRACFSVITVFLSS